MDSALPDKRFEIEPPPKEPPSRQRPRIKMTLALLGGIALGAVLWFNFVLPWFVPRMTDEQLAIQVDRIRRFEDNLRAEHEKHWVVMNDFLKLHRTSRRKKLRDPWGSQYRRENVGGLVSVHQYRSAGPDSRFFTRDDLGATMSRGLTVRLQLYNFPGARGITLTDQTTQRLR